MDLHLLRLNDDSCKICDKVNEGFEVLYVTFTPPPHPPHTQELSWATFNIHWWRYLHTIQLDYSTFGSWEEDVWNVFGTI